MSRSGALARSPRPNDQPPRYPPLTPPSLERSNPDPHPDRHARQPTHTPHIRPSAGRLDQHRGAPDRPGRRAHRRRSTLGAQPVGKSERSQAMSAPSAVIMGGSSGIGRASASEFLDTGHSVLITGRDADRLESAVMELRHAHQTADVRAHQVDARDPDQLRQLFGGLDSISHLVLALSGASGQERSASSTSTTYGRGSKPRRCHMSPAFSLPCRRCLTTVRSRW